MWVGPDKTQLDDPMAHGPGSVKANPIERRILQLAFAAFGTLLHGLRERQPVRCEVEDRVATLNVIGHSRVELATILDEIERHPLKDALEHGTAGSRRIDSRRSACA